MKKQTMLALCLAGLVGAVLFFLLRDTREPNQYARFLPPDVVTTINLTNASALADRLAVSPLARLFAKDTVQAIVREMGGQPQETAGYERLHDALTGMVNDPAFRALFGEDATLALLPPDMRGMREHPADALRNSLVVVARSSVAGALDMLSRLVKNAQVGRQTVDGLDLVTITVDRDQVLYGYTEGNTVLLAFAPAAIKTCVAIGKGGNGLDKAPQFKEAVTFWQTAGKATTYSRIYCDLARAAELLKMAQVKEIKEMGEMLQGMESMVSVTYGTEQGVESRGRAAFQAEGLHPQIKSAVEAAGANQFLRLLGESTLVYNWASSLRPEMIVAAMAADAQVYREADSEVRQTLGLSLEELGRAFGPQYGGVLDGIVKTPLFPWPKLTVFVSVRDRQLAETAFDGLRRTIAASGLTAAEQEQVGGQTIYSWPILPGSSAQPAAMLTDRMFVVATGKEALHDLLNAAATDGVPAPVAIQVGAEPAERIAAANFGSFVAFPRRMAPQVGETLEWLNAILAATRNISIARLSSELVHLLESTDCLVATSRLTTEQAQWTMTLTPAKPQPAAIAGK